MLEDTLAVAFDVTFTWTAAVVFFEDVAFLVSLATTISTVSFLVSKAFALF